MSTEPSLFISTEPSLFMYTEPSLFMYTEPSLFMSTEPSLFMSTEPSLFMYTEPSLFIQYYAMSVPHINSTGKTYKLQTKKTKRQKQTLNIEVFFCDVISRNSSSIEWNCHSHQLPVKHFLIQEIFFSLKVYYFQLWFLFKIADLFCRDKDGNYQNLLHASTYLVKYFLITVP